MSLPRKDSFLAGTLRRVPGSLARLPPAPGRTQGRTPTVVWAQPMQSSKGRQREGPAFAGAPRASARRRRYCQLEEEDLRPTSRFPTGSPRALQRTQLKGASRRSLHLKCPKHPARGSLFKKPFRYMVSPHPTLRELEPHSSFLERSPQALMSFSEEAPSSRPARQ